MIRKRLTYANAMSTIAVFLLLGGGAAIAAKQKPKRIGTNQIKAQAITTGKLKDGAVTSSKLAPGSVDGSKLADGAVGSSKLGGGAVTGAKIAAGAVAADQVAANSITGAQVNESSLSEVPTANSANPNVFAKIGSGGAVEAVNSKGLNTLDVSKPQTGVYCVNVPSFSPRGGQVTSGEPAAQIATIAVGGSGPCPQVAVRTFNAGGAAVDGAFYLEVYR